MTQLKVERVAVARYFESLGEVLGNAKKMSNVAGKTLENPTLTNSAQQEKD